MRPLQSTILFLSFLFAVSLPAIAQIPASPAEKSQESGASLQAFSSSVEELAEKVRGAVVQVVATGFAFSQDENSDGAGAVSTSRATGSGSILSADGYVMTNAHVVKNAQKITVLLRTSSNPRLQREQGYPATIIGIDDETDLALLKIDATDLPYLKPAATVPVRQGQIVMAFGSPRGLSNSLTMGVVSSPYRQVNDRDPVQYIQTDAEINPGNSGGPLLDTNGNLLGINSFIVSQSGGSEGLGFAIPARVVQHAFEQFLKNGRVRRGLIGVSARNLTPALIEGLSLLSPSGVLVEDIAPTGPADRAGLKIGDLVLSADGIPLEDARQLAAHVYRTSKDQIIKLNVQRGQSQFTLDVVADERPDVSDAFQQFSLTKSQHLIEDLGVFCLNITDEVAAMLPASRIGNGIVVAARAPSLSLQSVDLQAGDIIHEINRSPVVSLDTLRQDLDKLESGDAVVLQVERDGILRYTAFRME